MYSVSQREIGQHDNRVWLEVEANLLGCHTEEARDFLVRDRCTEFFLMPEIYL